jgi:methionine-rich copper-binding protein CopC
LPLVGEEMVIDVSMADFVELKAYGFRVNYDAEKLEFVRAVADNNLLGEGELAAPRVITKGDGEVAIAAYGDLVSEGDLGLSLVFRSTMEIESSFIEVMESEVRDGNFAVNGTALPAPLQIQTRPEAFALANNYPNPFNPATTIKYALPEASDVKLEIYNVVGQVVRTLVADHQNAGRYVVQWDATNDSGHSLSSGIYFYRLQAGGEFLEVKKMLLVK